MKIFCRCSKNEMRSPTYILERIVPLPVKSTEFMPRRLRKFLFPHMSHDQRRREIRFLIAALVMGLATAGIIAFAMILIDEMQLR
jgi:hypothetical protein